jgi:hypothetical protein
MLKDLTCYGTFVQCLEFFKVKQRIFTKVCQFGERPFLATLWSTVGVNSSGLFRLELGVITLAHI